jgi:hypothetical protein
MRAESGPRPKAYRARRPTAAAGRPGLTARGAGKQAGTH